MRIKIVFWGLICLLLIGGQVSVYAETEDRTSSISDEIKESISLDEIDDNLKNKNENRIPFSISDYVERVCEGDCELSIDTIADYIKEGAVSQWNANKILVFRLLLYAVLSGVFLNLTGSMYGRKWLSYAVFSCCDHPAIGILCGIFCGKRSALAGAFLYESPGARFFTCFDMEQWECDLLCFLSGDACDNRSGGNVDVLFVFAIHSDLFSAADIKSSFRREI